MEAHDTHGNEPQGRAMGAEPRETDPGELSPGRRMSRFGLILSMLSELAPSERFAVVRVLCGEVVSAESHARETGRYAAQVMMRQRESIAEVLDGPGGLATAWAELGEECARRAAGAEEALAVALRERMAQPSSQWSGDDVPDAAAVLQAAAEDRGRAEVYAALAEELACVSAMVRTDLDAELRAPHAHGFDTGEGCVRERENVCEHGDHPAPPGQRWCSEACADCDCGGPLCEECELEADRRDPAGGAR